MSDGQQFWYSYQVDGRDFGQFGYIVSQGTAYAGSVCLKNVNGQWVDPSMSPQFSITSGGSGVYISQQIVELNISLEINLSFKTAVDLTKPLPIDQLIPGKDFDSSSGSTCITENSLDSFVYGIVSLTPLATPSCPADNNTDAAQP